MHDTPKKADIAAYADTVMVFDECFEHSFRDPPYNRDNGRERLLILAHMVREGTLPEAGREYLAGALEQLAEGADLEKILLPKQRKEALSDGVVFAEVERERLKRDAMHGDMAGIYDAVGNRLGLSPGTAKKQASRGRTFTRAWLQDSIAAGMSRASQLGFLAKTLNLPADAIDEIFHDTR